MNQVTFLLTMEPNSGLVIFLVSCFSAFVQAEFLMNDDAFMMEDFTSPFADQSNGPQPFLDSQPNNLTTGSAGLFGCNSNVYGAASFVVSNRQMYISLAVANLSPGPHGVHIHSCNPNQDICSSIGGHYNPFSKPHSCSPSTGHLGDLGNIEFRNGIAQKTFTVPGMTLAWSNGTSGSRNPGVSGLCLCVDKNQDKCTPANDGNSGPQLACGIILPYIGQMPPMPPPSQAPTSG